ncbi:MAG: glycosyltransferase family 2 protein [Lentisphaeria bacterium]|nr:glycosyltransferase family 2 protein [Lentisphaeria bacterium]NQZ71390.1 glycosyltransferase family 2 protein [Lentisphaeria bacterium]
MRNKIRCFRQKLNGHSVKSELNKQKLVMTLAVKNEIGLIRSNLEFHLSQGVDLIIVRDNGSEDGTLEILREYAKNKPVVLIEQPTQNYNQQEWLNELMDIAVIDHQAGFVFHCDADEFFYSPKFPSLREFVNSMTCCDAYRTICRNYFLTDLGGKESFPKDLSYSSLGLPKRKCPKELWGHKCLLMKTLNITPYVGMGSHSILNDHEFAIHNHPDFIVAHFYSQGKEHFFQKVRVAGESLIKSNITSGHVHKRYQRLLDGSLDDEYKKHTFSEDIMKKYLADNFAAAVDNEELISFFKLDLYHE